MTSLVASILWNTTASIGFITKCRTQWLSCSTYFRYHLLENTQNGVFLVLCLIGTTYPNYFQLIRNFQYFQWSHATFDWPFILSYSSWSLLLNLWIIFHRLSIEHIVQVLFTSNISQKCLTFPPKLFKNWSWFFNRFFCSFILS